jgi:hypothetical protein
MRDLSMASHLLNASHSSCSSAEIGQFLMYTSHFETSINRAAHALTSLILDLKRTVKYFDIDIETEETRVGIVDVWRPEYPIVARNLRTRRDNLLGTIAILETAKRHYEETHTRII